MDSEALECLLDQGQRPTTAFGSAADNMGIVRLALAHGNSGILDTLRRVAQLVRAPP
jgi:hypothetical protein